ncbi:MULTISPECIES: hypothetical protein [unclassified Leifsonia]|uniref:hypothetical protein n=1 Tax=unclassified Leifsonia TaxID=2663824 RepID=UPI0006F55C0A|nr:MULTISPECIES: hypothetical protein [unclassified Leifsonia]KQX07997.1 hypothetical protein ASC59_09910 [Leifsonia sp. Root1293]KRA12279.1 hypothetical protein ASD61_09910 [Leifsonia sp. Root60]
MKNLPRAVAIAASSFLLAGCAIAPSWESELTTALEGADDSIALSSVRGIDGSAFLVVCPYESVESITDRLGFTWPGAPDYSTRDDRQTIAIVGDEEVTSSAEIPRDKVDFCSATAWKALPLDTSLTVTRSADVVLVSPAG